MQCLRRVSVWVVETTTLSSKMALKLCCWRMLKEWVEVVSKICVVHVGD